MPTHQARPAARRAWPRAAAILAALLVGGCAPGGAAERMQGRWVHAASSVELFADGRVLLRTPRGSVWGSYSRRAGAPVRVKLGAAAALYAHERGGTLSLCQLQNYRHCMRFHRPGRPVELISR